MYKQFYGLQKNPFDLGPDPRFFYPTAPHREALANLYYGVRRRKGFVVATGEVGTGKTLLIRFLLAALQKEQIAYAYVFNPRLDSTDFLRYVLADLQIPASGATKSELLIRLNEFLMNRNREGSTAVLVIDEAHLLSMALLEEIRLLTNLETGDHKLLQIMLVGQPELEQKLDSPALRQLKQRIALRCRLQPLTQADVRGYILRRLEIAGANSHVAGLFSEDAITKIYECSHGLPRLINTICENALISGFAQQVRTISPAIIDEVAADFRLTPEEESEADAEPELQDDRNSVVSWLLRAAESLRSSGMPEPKTTTARPASPRAARQGERH